MEQGLIEIFSQAGLTSPFASSSPPSEDSGRIRERLLNIIDRFSSIHPTTNLDHSLLATRFNDSTCPDLPVSPEHYLHFLEDTIVPHSINMASPTSMGHMTSAIPSFMRALGDVVLALNQNLVKKEASRTLTLLERQTLAMMHRLAYGFPASFYDTHMQEDASTLGIVTSGGTLANITALWIARNSCFGPAGAFAGIEEAGVAAALVYYHCRDAVIFGSRLMHYSFDKAAGILGFGADNVKAVPVDRQGRISVRDLRRMIADCVSRRQRVMAIVGIAGTTDCGSIDPLAEIADVADEWNIHFHVDAAWGAPLLFSRRYRSALAGIERAHSITIDGHKQLYLPIGSSMLLLRDPRAAKVIEKRTRYMLQERSGDLGKYSVEGSRPGTSLFLHAALHMIGSRGYESIIDDNIRKAHAMARMIRGRDEFELLAEPATNIVVYRYVPRRLRMPEHAFTPDENAQLNCFNEALQKAQSKAGRTFVSRTTVEHTPQGDSVPIVALRAVLTNPLAAEEHARLVLDDQAALGAELEERGDLGRGMRATDAQG